MKIVKAICLGMSAFALPLFAADWSSNYQAMAAFDPDNAEGNRPGYVKPIATYVGSVLNANWISNAGVPQAFTFEAGLPFNIVFLKDRDRTYSKSDVPTIFGDKAEYTYDNNLQRYVIGGNKNLNGLSVFTLPYLQLGGSFYHVRLVFRGMYFPDITQLQGYHLLGFGLQYSFGHFFNDKLPAGLRDHFDASLAFGYNSAYIGYRPDDFSGKLNLDFTATHTQLILGYSPFKPVDLMLSFGYETSKMESSGHLTYDKGGDIHPGITVHGRNGFRFGAEVAFSFGASFHPVVGGNFGTVNALNANVLYFKQSFGENKKPQQNAKDESSQDAQTAAEAPADTSGAAVAEQDYGQNQGQDSTQTKSFSPREQKKLRLRNRTNGSDAQEGRGVQQ